MVTSYHALPKPSGPARAPYALARFAFALDVRAQLEQMRHHTWRYGMGWLGIHVRWPDWAPYKLAGRLA